MNAPLRPGDLTTIAADECAALLEAAPWARVGFVLEGRPCVLPVNVLFHGDGVFFRTAAGSKLAAAAADGAVVLQADGGDADQRVGWSVLAEGHASIVTDPALEEALHAQPFEPWAVPDDKPFWVRVELERLSGRRIVRP